MSKEEVIISLSLEEMLKVTGQSYDSIVENYQDNENVYVDKTEIENLNLNFIPNVKCRAFINGVSGGYINRTRQKTGASLLYRLSDLQVLSDIITCFKSNFLTTKEAGELLSGDSRNILLPSFVSFSEQGAIKLYYVDVIGSHITYVHKNELNDFLESHISLEEATQVYQVAQKYFFFSSNKGKLQGVDQFVLTKTNRTMFVNKAQLKEIMKDSGFRQGLVTMKEACRLLDLTPISYTKAVTHYGIKFHLKKGIHESDFQFLKQEQERLLKNLNENYFSRRETTEILGYKSLVQLGNFNFYRLPHLLLLQSNDGSLIYISKKEVQERLLLQEINKAYEEMDVNNPYPTFLRIIQIKQLEFSHESQITKKQWLAHISTNLENRSTSNRKTIRLNILCFVEATEGLIQLTQGKELIRCFSKEINLALLNKGFGTIRTRQYLFDFMAQYDNEIKRKGQESSWNLRGLNSPYDKEAKTTNSKTIYTPQEYINLVDHSAFSNRHVEEAINDIDFLINGETQKYRQYASAWLYILIHLTNAWRHSDVANFPRINLEQTSVYMKDLRYLKTQGLTEQDIDIVIAKIQSKRLFHSKTGAERHFFYSEELKSAIVYAVVISELRCQQCTPYADSLIDFTGEDKRMHNHTHKLFFDQLGQVNFRFKSRQMNRTVLSFIYSVIKDQTGRNPLELGKTMRSHESLETTNIYTVLPKEYLDKITGSLFNLGNFGYVYSLMTKLLTADVTKNPEIQESDAALQIKRFFGDVIHVEDVIKSLSHLEATTRERDELKKHLMESPREQLEEMYMSAKLGVNPAKEQDMLCLFSQCKMEAEGDNRTCHRCPYAIHHFYSLSALGGRITNKITKFNHKFVVAKTDGERTRLANLLYGDLDLLTAAIAKFGKHMVSEFIVESDLNELREHLSTIEDHSEYRTLLN